jgi:ATPase subunit of ABC transporter with duplicated ATPase domains
VPTRSHSRPLSAVQATLVCRGVSLDCGAEPVLHDMSFTIGPGTCLGVVGPNGVGKSTLLKLLAGLVAPDSGNVVITPRRASCMYIEQEHDPIPGETLRQALVRRSGIGAADLELKQAAQDMVASEPGAAERYADALERISALGTDVESAVDAVLGDSGLESIAGRDTSVLSGGEAAKLALAAVALAPADILLLDEPTNDLDFEGLDQIEKLVTQRHAATVVVSHDRAFLERTVTSVLEIDEHDHTCRVFEGGWTAYEEERATARRHAAEAYQNYDSQKRKLEQRSRREQDWATTGVSKERRAPRDNDKAQRDFRINRTETLAARARRTERAAERLEVVDKPWEGWQLRFSIGETQRAGEVVCRLDSAVVERGVFRLGPIDLQLSWGERLAVTGRNGAGKSTLVGAMLGRISISQGSSHLGPAVVVGELGQERDALSGPGTLLEAVCDRCSLTVTDARTLLAKFGLGAEHVTRSAASLSPGERTRAELATFQARGVNLLVLDEPTNHLDLPAIEQLEQAIDAFGGTVILVTHDRRLLEQVRLTRRLEVP